MIGKCLMKIQVVKISLMTKCTVWKGPHCSCGMHVRLCACLSLGYNIDSRQVSQCEPVSLDCRIQRPWRETREF